MVAFAQVEDGYNVFGWYRSCTKTVTPGSNVAAGGEAVAAVDVGLMSIVDVYEAILLDSNGANIRWAVYNFTTKKLQYFSASGTESTGNLSGFVGRMTFVGKG